MFFTLFVGPYLSTGTVFFFFFFQYPKSPKLILKKKKIQTANANPERERKKQKNKNCTANPRPKKKEQTANANPGKKKKSVKKWSKVAAMGPLCVFNYNIVIQLWIIKTENNQKLFSVSITHNSKIRELSNENRVMETELLFTKQTFCYGSHHFWVMSYGNKELSYQKTRSKHALSICKEKW